ncbi:MAG: PSD1 and planctomycete cytochrome C domain-containing protein [Planctomycetota bacterium]|nr:PSD1 and planctomycete cytochrome C domain-containing protein [Planctomycetota bacterium]
MPRFHLPFISLALAFHVGVLSLPAGAQQPGVEKPTAEQLEFFEKNIRPLLVTHCYKCHSRAAKPLKGGLFLDHREGAIKGGDSGPVIVPGKPAESLLVKSVKYLDYEMPPDGKLPAEKIQLMEQWVAMGAFWPEEKSSPLPKDSAAYDWDALREKHWSFQPVTRPLLPDVRTTDWAQSPLDFFVLSRLEAVGLSPSSQADRRTLIRRASLDLTGLPPSPAAIAHFLADSEPGAFGRVVDRLLSSPRYGEQWGRHWLDVARYSDGMGGSTNNARLPHAWQYRDWVVNAWNRDRPFDEFVRSQLAGDLTGRWQDRPALGFVALGPTYVSDGGDPDSVAQARAETLDDRVDTVSRGLLGLTVSCARCHDHKFDPIPTLDYYSLAGVFNNSRNIDSPLASDEVIAELNRFNAAVAEKSNGIKQIQDRLKKEKREASEQEKKELAELEAAQKNIQQNIPPSIPMPVPTVHTLGEAGNKDMPVALRGNPRKPGPIAPRRFLRIVAGADPPVFQKGSGRLELANAITAPDNPLTSRVIVNRVWQRHFGSGLVGSPSNFGYLGQPPTHPGLLDWLASELVDRDWSLKSLHRTIMLSATYRMSSGFDEKAFAIDGDNKLLWRFSPRRLTVESWRDSLLQVCGELATNLGGPPTEKILSDRRRTLYTVISRNGDRFESDTFLRLFDFPAPRATSSGRVTSTVPQQFLFMLNSEFMAERSRQFAERLNGEFGNDQERIAGAYQLLYGRDPLARELELGLAFLGSKPNAVQPAGPAPPEAGEDLLIADFEGSTYGDWKTTGEAFGPGPAQGTLPGQMAVSGFRGRGLVNSFFQGDRTTGTLTSPPILLQRTYIHFLVGGGKYPGTTCINLLVAGKVVRTATGPNDRGGGSEKLAWASWNIAEFQGKQAIIEVVDRRTGGWGHINVDHLLQSNQALDSIQPLDTIPSPAAESRLTRWQQYAQVLLSSNEFMFMR